MDRYLNIPKTRTTEGTRLYKSVKYPIIPRSINDIYVITTDGDRYDRLAQQYYSDSSLWWVISAGNAEYEQGSLFPPVGVQLRIPGDLSSILSAYSTLNQ